jgi:hypothetical protein
MSAALVSQLVALRREKERLTMALPCRLDVALSSMFFDSAVRTCAKKYATSVMIVMKIFASPELLGDPRFKRLRACVCSAEPSDRARKVRLYALSARMSRIPRSSAGGVP